MATFSGNRIWAVMLRYLYATRDPARIVEFTFWPMIDIGFYGLIATWSGQVSSQSSLVNIFITALVLWQIIYRAHFEVCVNVLDEFLEHNLLNLVASPLRKIEWVFAMMGGGIIKIFFTVFFGAFVAWLFFKINVFSIGICLVPLIFLCLLSGWIIGFLGAGLVIYKGPKLQQLPWVIIMLWAIISAVFYPLEVLPNFLRFLSQIFPMSYIFQGMRVLLTSGCFSFKYFIISTLLSFLYLMLAIKFFLYMFRLSRQRGQRLT